MKKLIFLATIVLFTFFLFRETLFFFFVSDDFFHLSFKNIIQAISLQPAYQHYSPLFWLTLLGLKSVFGMNPFPFHFFALTLHLVNILLVFLLAKILLESDKNALLASFVFAVFFSHYEVVYWVTGISTSLMVFFYILSLLSFIHFTKSAGFPTYFLFLLFFISSILSHEYGLSLFFVSLMYWFLFSDKKKAFFETGKIFLFPLIFIVILILTKTYFSEAPSVAKVPTVSRFTASIVKSYLYFFIPSPYLVDNIPRLILKLIFIPLMFFLTLKSISERISLFFFLWLATTVIMFSATSLPQARYFYLSSIPAILLIISLLPLKMKKGIFASLGYLLLIISSGIIFLQEQKGNWRTSSEITKNILKDVKRLYQPSNKTLYFVNLPDSVNGPPWNAYVWRNSLNEALILIDDFRPEKIYFYKTPSGNGTIRNDPAISLDELALLKEKEEMIFIYDKEKKTVILASKK